MSSLQLVDALIAKVKALQSSDSTSDAFWGPTVAHGHTPFSWTGQGGPSVDGIGTGVEVKSQGGVAAVAKEKKGAKAQGNAKRKNEKAGKKDKKEKKQKQKQPKAKQAATPDQPPITMFEFKVGQIVSAKDHPNADTMFVEMIDVGEGKPRQICSGLKGKIPLDVVQSSRCIVVSNLKEANLRKEPSNGMVLCASSETETCFIQPPAGSKPGDRLFLKGQGDIFAQNPPLQNINIKKKKNNLWDLVKDSLHTDADGNACFDGVPFATASGVVTSTVKNGKIK